jgi:hypothetical protein
LKKFPEADLILVDENIASVSLTEVSWLPFPKQALPRRQ